MSNCHVLKSMNYEMTALNLKVRKGNFLLDFLEVDIQ